MLRLVGFFLKLKFLNKTINQPRRDGVWLFLKGIGLGFNPFMTAAEPSLASRAQRAEGIKPSPRIKFSGRRKWITAD